MAGKLTRPCPRCDGTGSVWVTKATGPDARKTCPQCNGTGKVAK